MIYPPYNDDRGNDKDKPRLLSRKERSERLQAWEDQGYDTRGFGFWRRPDTGEVLVIEGQGRPIYPRAEDMHSEWLEKEYKISIPDLDSGYFLGSQQYRLSRSSG